MTNCVLAVFFYFSFNTAAAPFTVIKESFRAIVQAAGSPEFIDAYSTKNTSYYLKTKAPDKQVNKA